MKTKELIRQLQLLDPSGEEHCTVDSVDILFVDRLPGYYDGNCEELIRDEKRKGYNVIGAKIKRKPDKIIIRSHSIEDALCDNPDLPIDTSELNKEDSLARQERYDKLRKEFKDVHDEINKNR